MTIAEALKKIEDFGYSVKEKPENMDVDAGYFTFEKTEYNRDHHVVTIEDHRWERISENFDPINNPYDIGEWLIFSCIDNDERDYFGRFVETQYPLTLPEVEAFLSLIRAFEEEQNANND